MAKKKKKNYYHVKSDCHPTVDFDDFSHEEYHNLLTWLLSTRPMVSPGSNAKAGITTKTSAVATAN